MPDYPTIADTIGNTPLVRIQRLAQDSSNIILGKLELVRLPLGATLLLLVMCRWIAVMKVVFLKLWWH